MVLKKNGFDMDSFDAKIAEIERRNRELADEFYARHPELDDRVKDESATMFTSIGSDAGAGIGAATLGTDNNISPVGSGTVDEGYEDEVGFGVNSDQAYRAVMAKFGDYIEHRDDGIMYAPRELWSAIEQTAFDADGVGAEEDSGIAEDQHSDFESKDSIRVWENIDDRLDMEEKMSIFESWSRGQLNESADEHKLEYFRSLEHYSSNPVVGKTYIVVPLALSHQLRALSVPEKCKYLGFKNHMHLVENQVGDVKKYPYAPFRPNSSFICFFFDSINKYNQFRSSISVKFNLSLSDINEELNTGGSNQEPASDSTSPVGGVAEGLNEFTPDNGGEITERINQKSIQAGFKDHQKVMGGKFDLYADSDGRTLTVKLHDPNADFWEVAAWARFEVKGLFFMKNLQSLKTWVEPQYRRMGLATTIYQYVQNLGNTIKPAVVRTDMGKAMWKGFKSKGVAEGVPKTYTRGDPHPDQEFYFPVKDQWPEKLGPMGKPRKRKDVDVSEDIAEDVYESRLYRMKLAGYDIK